MYLSKDACLARLREAENARKNRREIVQALSHGQIARRDLFRWGLLGATGLLVAKNGLSRWATSAMAQVPTGTPPSPTFGIRKFTQPMPRPRVEPHQTLTKARPTNPNSNANWPSPLEPPARKSSYHSLFNTSGGTQAVNPVTGRGPMEGRPPGVFFEHQRWAEADLFPHYGYTLSLGQCQPGTKIHPSPNVPEQEANSVWCFGPRPFGTAGHRDGLRTGSLTPTLIKARYGEPFICRIYNDLPADRTQNNGFGRNEISTHLHNVHNGAESDGACNAYHFPGTFYDYHWPIVLARRDLPSVWLTSDPRHLDKASGPDDGDGLVRVPGDFREIQGSMWFHDHRFFFTAENVHKGHFAVCNIYSGPDRAREDFDDGVNLRLPSGSRLKFGNTDFDVNLVISNPAFDQAGQLFFDIFDTEGFLGDLLFVNGAYYPYMEVLPRRYRFRTLNAAMARFIKLAMAVNRSSRFSQGTKVPFYFIANDGNLVVNPIKLTELDEQGVAERYDFVVDFSQFNNGDSIYLVNLLQQRDGRKPDGSLSVSNALKGSDKDPAVGPILEFRVVDALQSVDDPNFRYQRDASGRIPDDSANFEDDVWKSGVKRLTAQIPIVAPVRERTIQFVRNEPGDSRQTADGQCIPECGEYEFFPWSIKVSGRAAHSLNANRISAMIPKPGEVEHWTLENSSGGWDHPIHLHFEEGVTFARTGRTLPATERLVRKDVWRLGTDGSVKFQVRFGEFGGAYVAHCHNTTHEDFAMLMRMQLLTHPPGHPDFKGQPQHVPTRTPIPTPNGVRWKTPEILPEGDPNNPEFKKRSDGST
ncbi:MAG: multicopper oxidase domain-containing protein [Hyphomicrobium sp.]